MVGRIWLTILNTPCTPAGAADPIAFGQPAPGPRDVGMSGCLAVWLSGCLGGCLTGWVSVWLDAGQPPNRPTSKPSKLAPKTIQLEATIPPKSVPRGLLEGSWGVSWRGLGGVLGALGGSWEVFEGILKGF